MMMKVISRLNQVHVNSSYSTDDGHFPELLLRWNGSVNMGGMSLSAFPSRAACRLFTITWSSACPPPLSLPLFLVIFQSRHPSFPPPPPQPSLLSGHPPCLFRWNRRGNESQSPLLTHSWDFGPTIVCTAVVFSISASMHWSWFCTSEGKYWFYYGVLGKIAQPSHNIQLKIQAKSRWR